MSKDHGYALRSRSKSPTLNNEKKHIEREEKAVNNGHDDVIFPQREKYYSWPTKDIHSKEVDWFAVVCVLLLSIITICTSRAISQQGAAQSHSEHNGAQDTVKRHPVTMLSVFYYGWITALSTGAGAVPLIFIRSLQPFWIGVSNALTTGMMVAASWSLVKEAISSGDDNLQMQNVITTLVGLMLGSLFLEVSSTYIDSDETKIVGEDKGYSIFHASRRDTKKMLLIIFVMTLHSFTEGVGIGVSFGGKGDGKLGVFISASLAVHNVPEGLAVALVLIPRGVSKLRTALWAIFTSLPQPIMAVPAFVFVEVFSPMLSIGLGFAAGAMFCVCVKELYPESIEATNSYTITNVVVASSFVMMMMMQSIFVVD